MAKSKKNGSAKTTAPATDTDETAYRAAVVEGKALTAGIEALTLTVSGKQWALGDLAAKVEKAYGEKRLAHFAEDINFAGADCTLGRYRSVCVAFPKTGVRPRFFAVAQALAAHPDCIEIVKRTPDISVSGARAIIKKWRDENPDAAKATAAKDDDLPDEDQPEEDQIEPAEDPAPAPEATSAPAKAANAKGPKRTADKVQEDLWLSDTKKWFGEVCVHANAATELNEVMKCTAEQRRQLALAIEPELAEKIFEDAAKAYLMFVAWFKKALAEASREVKGRVKTSPSPKRRKEPVQPEA